jgi:hypothetical protein
MRLGRLSGDLLAQDPDLQVFTSYNEQMFGNSGMLLATMSIPTVAYMPSPRSPTNGPTTLPHSISEFVEAANGFDLDRLVATFAHDALVNDQLRDYWGEMAIRSWAERDIIGERLTIAVTKIVSHYGNFVVTANVDGNFDKRGLPDPLVLAFYFTPYDELIVQLIILRNGRDV